MRTGTSALPARCGRGRPRSRQDADGDVRAPSKMRTGTSALPAQDADGDVRAPSKMRTGTVSARSKMRTGTSALPAVSNTMNPQTKLVIESHDFRQLAGKCFRLPKQRRQTARGQLQIISRIRKDRG